MEHRGTSTKFLPQPWFLPLLPLTILPSGISIFRLCLRLPQAISSIGLAKNVVSVTYYIHSAIARVAKVPQKSASASKVDGMRVQLLLVLASKISLRRSLSKTEGAFITRINMVT